MIEFFNIDMFKQQIRDAGPRVIAAIAVFFVGWFVVKLLVYLLRKALSKSRHVDKLLHTFILSVARILLIIILAIACVGVAEIPTAPLVTALGALGLALSLAIKDGLADLAGGIFLLVAKRFSVGDYVEIGSVSGIVDKIDLVNTVLKGFDNKIIYIPNAQVASSLVVNYSSEPRRRLDIVFSIGYEDDFELAKRIILRVIESSSLPVMEPAPVIRVSAHTPRSLDIVSRVWVNTENFYELQFYMLEQVKKEFDKAGITIPHLPAEPFLSRT